MTTMQALASATRSDRTMRLAALALASAMSLGLPACGSDEAPRDDLTLGATEPSAPLPEPRDVRSALPADADPSSDASSVATMPKATLRGSLLIPGSGVAYDIDLATRRARELPSGFNDATLDGSRLLYWNYRRASDDYEISIRDRNGARLSTYQPFDEYFSDMRFSPDGRMFGFRGDFANPVLAVIALDGKLSRRIADKIESFAFMPDSRRVIFSVKDTIYMHDVQANTTTGVVAFRGQTPTRLAPSPDGRRIALTMGNMDVLRNHVYMFDLRADGSAGPVRQVTTSESNEDFPTWSPDGSLLMVRYGLVYNTGLVGSGGCSRLYVIPSTATAPIKVGTASDALSLDVVYSNGTRNCAQGKPVWIAR